MAYSFDFPFLQRTVASVVIVAVRAAHCSLVAQFDDVSQAIPVEKSQLFVKNSQNLVKGKKKRLNFFVRLKT